MEDRKKNRLTALAAGLLLAAQPLFPAEARRMHYVMGTLLEVSVTADDAKEAAEAAEAAFGPVEELDRLLSNYRGDSEISKLNGSGFPDGVKVSSETADFLAASLKMGEETRGAFDITVEPLTRLWRLRDRRRSGDPGEAEVREARAKVDYRKLELLPDGRARFEAPGMGVDTGGIGKGYALDKALGRIRTFKVRSATLNFGGEILYWSEKPCEQTVSVRDPSDKDRVWKSFEAKVGPEGLGVSTSGNYERFVTVSGKGPAHESGHILDPGSGRPAEGEIRSVTALARTGTEADGLSTAVFAEGFDKGRALADDLKDAGILILYEVPGEGLRSYKSKNWAKFVKDERKENYDASDRP